MNLLKHKQREQNDKRNKRKEMKTIDKKEGKKKKTLLDKQILIKRAGVAKIIKYFLKYDYFNTLKLFVLTHNALRLI